MLWYERLLYATVYERADRATLRTHDSSKSSRLRRAGFDADLAAAPLATGGPGGLGPDRSVINRSVPSDMHMLEYMLACTIDRLRDHALSPGRRHSSHRARPPMMARRLRRALSRNGRALPIAVLALCRPRRAAVESVVRRHLWRLGLLNLDGLVEHARELMARLSLACVIRYSGVTARASHQTQRQPRDRPPAPRTV